MELTKTTRRGTAKWDQRQPLRRATETEPDDSLLKPCVKGHETCGCRFTAFGCCLVCPRPTCVYDEIDAEGREETTRPYTLGAERALRIVELARQGKAAHEIREELGLTRTQYLRAVQKHSGQRTPVPTSRPGSRTAETRQAVRCLLESGEPRRGIWLELTTTFGVSRSRANEIIREERRRLEAEAFTALKEAPITIEEETRS